MGCPAVILVMCGCSVATTTLVAVKLEEEAKRRRVKVRIEKGMISDLDRHIAEIKPDLIVATATTKPPKDICIFSGVPLISSVGQSELYDDLFSYISQQGLG